jgi:hypothetical protein
MGKISIQELHLFARSHTYLDLTRHSDAYQSEHQLFGLPVLLLHHLQDSILSVEVPT